jgi:sterol desaturase/sphingolipid hydroxylase (fatty acid hydroxylase superfamily)
MEIWLIRLIVFGFGLALMLGFESFFSARKWTDRRSQRLFFHAGLMAFNTIFLRYPAVMPLMMLGADIESNRWGISSMFGLSTSANIVITFILFDMLNYWWHRFNHRLRFLWRFHKVHHVDTHCDVSTSLRFHPGELLFASLFKAVWLLVWGPGILAFVIFESGVTLAAQFHHANIDFPDRIENLIRTVFVTPRYHAAHHTVSRRTGDANFATIFIFWDKIFRTYGVPDYTEMEYLGLPSGRDNYLSIGATLKGPFSKIY